MLLLCVGENTALPPTATSRPYHRANGQHASTVSIPIYLDIEDGAAGRASG
jgi:hypothetical protein